MAKVLPDISKKIAELEAKNAELTALLVKAQSGANRAVTVKLSSNPNTRGCIIVGGVGAHPVCLYRSQWQKLIPFIPTVAAFIESNKSELDAAEIARAAKRQ